MRSGIGMSIAAGVAVFVAAAAWVATESSRSPGADTEQTIEQQLEQAFAAGGLGEFHQVFREEFPSEYASFVETAVSMIADGSPPASINREITKFTTRLRRTQSDHAGRASLGKLDQVMRNQLAIAEKLKTLDVALCSKFLVESLTPAEQKTHRDVAPLLTKASTVTLEAIADGRRRKVVYEKSTAEDWQEVTTLMARNGASGSDLALLDPVAAAKVGPERVCNAGVAMLAAMLALDPEPRGRILSELVTLMVRN